MKHDENITTPALTNNLQLQPITQEFDCVTIFYGDIIGFDELVADCSPTEVTLLFIFIQQLKIMISFQLIDFMNLLYGNLDERFKKFQVYNLPTMGMDEFMVLTLFIFNVIYFYL